jgi:hypothetical protein
MNDARDAMRSICSRRRRIAERSGVADVVVIPAKAGIHRRAIAPQTRRNWISACAGLKLVFVAIRATAPP